MCQRKENEPVMSYWFRQLVEKPTPFIALCCMAAAVYVYNDMQRSNDRNSELQLQTAETLGKVSSQLDLINTRLEHLEREHEAARTSPRSGGL